MSNSIGLLHVDDDPRFRDMTAKFLNQEADQFEIIQAGRVAEAREQLHESAVEIDCIVSDYDLPDMTGVELLKTVREEYPNLPFILFTGKGSEAVASDAITAGVTDYLQKQSGTDQYTVLANRITNAVSAVQAKSEASRARHQHQQTLKAVPACVVRFNREGQFVFANDRAQEILGLEKSAVTSRTYNDPDWDITDLDGNPIPDEQLPFRQVVNSGEPLYGFQHTIKWPDGTRRVLHVNGTPLFDDTGAVKGALFALTDITANEERQHQLRETTRRFDLALRTTDTGVWEWNMETDDVVWTESLEQLLGIEPGTFEGTFEAHAEYVHPDDMSKINQAIDEAITIGGAFQAEFRMIREDGEEIWVEGRGELLADEVPRRMIGITTDITERKQYERNLKRQNERLDAFARFVSHDLRNPLNMADGWVELARQECDSEHLDEIDRVHDRMRALIEDVLTLAREGDRVGEMESVELDGMVKTCWRTVETHKASLSVDTDATIKADSGRLQQLLENLIRNAVEHGGEDVRVTVGTLADGEGFFVADDGRGISTEDRDQVFKEGYSTRPDGTGLGLNIVREIATAHGWTVRVTESEDGGARFEISDVQLNGDE